MGNRLNLGSCHTEVSNPSQCDKRTECIIFIFLTENFVVAVSHVSIRLCMHGICICVSLNKEKIELCVCVCAPQRITLSLRVLSIFGHCNDGRLE